MRLTADTPITLWWCADDNTEAAKWKAEVEAAGDTATIYPPNEHSGVVDVEVHTNVLKAITVHNEIANDFIVSYIDEEEYQDARENLEGIIRQYYKAHNNK